MNMVQDFFEKINRTEEGKKKLRVTETEMLENALDCMELEDSWSNRKYYKKEIRNSLTKLRVQLSIDKDKLKVVSKRLERRIYGN